MTQFHALSFDKLRNVGNRWDPIGVLGGTDEYDEYLLEAVFMYKTGRSEADVASYLADVETTRMGFGDRAKAEEAARAAALDLKAYLDSLPR
jgi:hypothetical protein